MVQLSQQQHANARRHAWHRAALAIGLGRKYKCRSLGLVTSLVLALAAGCQKSSPLLLITVPTGYRGAFIIHTGDPTGIGLKDDGGTYRCNVPKSGVLKIRGKGPFYTWHGLKVSFANGDIIPISDQGENLGDDVVAYWSGGSAPGGMVYGFIGTRPEAQAWYKETETGEVIPGKVRDQPKNK